MKMSYSLDLRKKVIRFLEKTPNMLEASRNFDVSYNTVRDWFKAYKEENRLAPREPYRQAPYKLDWEEFKIFVEENPDWHQAEYAARFNVSRSQIGKVLKILGFTHKKKR